MITKSKHEMVKKIPTLSVKPSTANEVIGSVDTRTEKWGWHQASQHGGTLM
jgi:hypothetical protein